jgi:acid phosphatase class B
MKNLYKNLLVVMMLLTINLTANAQPDEPGGDPGTPVAPIGDYVPLMLIAAIGLGYFVIKKQQIKEV